jgi:hypothetical protein
MIFHSYVSLPEGKPSPTKVYYWIYDWDDFFWPRWLVNGMLQMPLGESHMEIAIRWHENFTSNSKNR